MPRNSSGNYTLPSGNPTAPNTLIETAWSNPTMSDIGSELTNSLDRQGRGTMLAPLKVVDGSAVTPAFAFNSEASTGMYRVASHVLGLAVAGALVASFADNAIAMKQPLTAEQTLTVTGITTLNNAVNVNGALSVTGAFTLTGAFTPTGVINLPLGTAALPSLTFQGDPNTGLYSPAADQVALTTGGAQRLSVSPAGNIAINAPTSGTAAFITGVAGAAQPVLELYNAQNTAATEVLRLHGGTGGVGSVGPSLVWSSNSLAAHARIYSAVSFAGGTDATSAGSLTIAVNNSGWRDVMAFAAAGNVVINAPASGDPLNLIGDLGLNFKTTAGVAYMRAYVNSGAASLEAVGAAVPFNLNVNGATRLVGNTNGTFGINTPTAGVALTVNGLSGQFAANFNNGSGNQCKVGFLAAALAQWSVGVTTTGSFRIISENTPVTVADFRGAGGLDLYGAGGNELRVYSSLENGTPCISSLSVPAGNPQQFFVAHNLAVVNMGNSRGALNLFASGSQVATCGGVTPGYMSLTNSPGEGTAGNYVATCAYVLGNTVGAIGRVWTNVLSSPGRALNVDYTSPGYPITVSVSWTYAGNSANVNFVVGGVTIASFGNGGNGASANGHSFVVQPNTVYRMNNSVAAVTINFWAELK